MNNRTYNKLLETALPLIRDIDSRAKHVAFILKRNKILGVGVNKINKTHPICTTLGYRFSTLHAETDVILKTRGMREFKTGVELVSIRINPLSRPDKIITAMGRPCAGCIKLIVAHSEIKKVYYSSDEKNPKILW